MAATIKIKNSSTASAVPTSSDLVQGELAVNVTDKRIFTENASGTVVELGTNPTILTLPDGSASAPTLTNDGDTNTGIFFPAADTVGITTGGTERARVDSSGNLGLGVTPSAWVSTWRALDISTYTSVYGASGNTSGFSQNAYYNGTNWIYRNTNAASNYIQSGGQHEWHRAGSGTAGNTITFTQAMTLDASGNLLVGSTGAAFAASGRGLIEVNGTSTGMYGLKANGAAMGYLACSTSVVELSTNGAYPLLFTVNGAERARIDTSGNLLVGATSVVTTEKLNSTNASGAAFRFNGSTASGAFLGDDLNHYMTTYNSKAGGAVTHYQIGFFNSSGTLVGAVTHNFSNTTYATSSDYRLKENIAPMTGALNVVAQLSPCTYTWKETGEAGQGFIAHELQAVVPDAVVGEKDAVNEDGSIKPQGIDTSFLVATLTAAIQELKETVDAQAARITALEQA